MLYIKKKYSKTQCLEIANILYCSVSVARIPSVAYLNVPWLWFAVSHEVAVKLLVGAVSAQRSTERFYQDSFPHRFLDWGSQVLMDSGPSLMDICFVQLTSWQQGYFGASEGESRLRMKVTLFYNLILEVISPHSLFLRRARPYLKEGNYTKEAGTVRRSLKFCLPEMDSVLRALYFISTVNNFALFILNCLVFIPISHNQIGSPTLKFAIWVLYFRIYAL